MTKFKDSMFGLTSVFLLFGWCAYILNAQELSLPPIETLDTVEVPQKEATTYNEAFLTGLFLRADNENCQIRLKFQRYNFEKKELMPTDIEILDENGVKIEPIINVTVENAYDEAGKYTQWQQILGGIIQLSPKILKKDQLQKKVEALEEDQTEEKAALEAQIQAINESMGIIE